MICMNKKTKFDWKAFIVAMFLLVAFVGGINLIDSQTEKDYKFGDLEIDSDNLGDIITDAPEGPLIICSMKTDKCTIINKEKIERDVG